MFRKNAVVMCCVSVLLAGCGSGGQAQPKLLVITPNAQAKAPILALAPSVNCRPAAEHGPAYSRLAFVGPCAFTETARLQCVQRIDDYYAYVYRKLPQGWSLYTTINIEYYTRPDTYKQLTEIYVEVTKGLATYAWGQRLGTATVSPGGLRLTLPFTNLAPWPGTLSTQMEQIGGYLTCRSLTH